MFWKNDYVKMTLIQNNLRIKGGNLKVSHVRKFGVLGIVISGIILTGMLGWTTQRKDTLVELGNQQSEIEAVLAIKSIKKAQDFRGIRWLENGQILGVMNQPLEKDSKLPAKLAIYDPAKETFEVFVTAKQGERIGIGKQTSDERYVFYSTLNKGDYNLNRYQYSVLDLHTKKARLLIDQMTATCSVPNSDDMIAATGMALYKFNCAGEKTEIKLPLDLVRALSDFSKFTFKDYKEKYYSDLKDPQGIKQIKENYANDVRYNAINIMANSGDHLVFASRNNRYFSFNMKTQSYHSISAKTFSDSFPAGSDIEGNRIKLETLKDGSRQLWQVDQTGKKMTLIAEGEFLCNMKESPDQTKVAYTMNGKTGSSQSFIYEFDTQKRVKLFSESVGWVTWNANSEQFFIRLKNDMTMVVTLNKAKR